MQTCANSFCIANLICGVFCMLGFYFVFKGLFSVCTDIVLWPTDFNLFVFTVHSVVLS